MDKRVNAQYNLTLLHSFEGFIQGLFNRENHDNTFGNDRNIEPVKKNMINTFPTDKMAGSTLYLHAPLSKK